MPACGAMWSLVAAPVRSIRMLPAQQAPAGPGNDRAQCKDQTRVRAAKEMPANTIVWHQSNCYLKGGRICRTNLRRQLAGAISASATQVRACAGAHEEQILPRHSIPCTAFTTIGCQHAPALRAMSLILDTTTRHTM
jgi:hypothetical protein